MRLEIFIIIYNEGKLKNFNFNNKNKILRHPPLHPHSYGPMIFQKAPYIPFAYLTPKLRSLPPTPSLLFILDELSLNKNVINTSRFL